ncbi:hypothetical protein FGSG_04869 [Fusarium graminearum PH-1]|uniref:tyrosinase n=1 Tax=Gibberella zeae (strain ATCC MYA-4620 / CBS 123657 / FGSC 9075 / NRRL 31084 / PH-1) TaxID=229533 RepID=I1RLQ5_GIBZE|nr:hypothetical protein FGSG_04869 [Fusarium graminearum PH-1]ESU10758.1 hypothetical protein FGSG_04869 [Fusarium graminearum PH-1]CEF87237.1 unnamed protein product [Fusarium graminearum]|eukprot:XP_011323334.1 hypothetical protein FGSG_04869 [Fusarium graminearum PH-1]
MTDNSGTYGIKGLPRPKDAVTRHPDGGIPYIENLPVRYEISVLASSTDPLLRKQWTLFVLALEKFKMKPVSEKLSYFQVAGIHGYPEGAWDNAPPPKQDLKNPKKGDQPYGGYCNHNGLNFPTWHRPYMALFEQCVWDNMDDVINHWVEEHKLDQDKAELALWNEAKDTWRMQYWDWARQQSYNEDFAYPQVLVQGPDEDGNPRAFGDMLKGKRDYNIEDDPVKHNPAPPRDKEDVAWIRQKAQAKTNKDFYLKWNPGTLADSVNRMFSPKYNTTWGQFASTKWTYEGYGNSMNGFLSLEYIHNNVHNIVGGSDFATGVGHMSDVPVAAFDPIFWLHHTQIDRLLSIWQCLYPKLWWDQKEPTRPGEVNVPDDTEDDYLYPFHDKDNGGPVTDVWIARKCRDWTVFNYQYDDLMDLSQKALNAKGNLDEPRFQKLLQAYIHNTYPCTEHLLRDIKDNRHVHIPAGLTPDVPNIDDNSWKDYIINVRYDRYALGGQSYTINFYLGGPTDEAVTHFEPQNFVGSVYTFGGGSRKTLDSCANCKTQADAGVLSCAQVPLTIQLLHHTIDCTQVTVLRGVGQPNHVVAPKVRTSELQTFSVAAADISVSESPAVSTNGTNGTNGSAGGAPVTLPPVYNAQPYEALPEITNNKYFGLQHDGTYMGGR